MARWNELKIRPHPLTTLPLFLSLVGCAVTAATVQTSYLPTTPARPLEGARKAKFFLGKVDDQTGGIYGIMSYGNSAVAKFTPPLPEVLRQAFLTELGRLEIPVASTPNEADAILDVTALEASIDDKDLTGGTLSFSLSVKSPLGRAIWSKSYKGHQSPIKGSASAVMTGALADAMSQIGPLLESENVLAKIFSSHPAASIQNAASELVEAPAPHSDIDDMPAPAASALPKAHAVVIGIRNYRQKLPDAEFADNDARLASKYLTLALGYQDENVATLINGQASKSDFEKYFERWLPNRVETGDEVFVFFSGYGAPNPTSGDAYLVPYDGDPTYLKQTGYPLARMYAALAKLPAKRITVVLDSCFSGAGGRSVLAKGAKPLVNATPGREVPANVTVLLASAGDQVSRNYDGKGHGLFTYFFLKGIKENAGKGGMELRKIFDFAAAQVSKTARRDYGSDQNPQWQEGK